MTDELRELSALYAEETKLPEFVCFAFIREGLEPPSRDRVDRIGYTAREARLFTPLLSTPPGSID